MIQLGIYEQLVTKMVSNKLNELDTNIFYLSTRNIDKVEASKVLTTYLSAKINLALSLISGEDSILKQIELANQIILLLASELNNNDFQDDIIETEAKILYGVFSKIDNPMVDFEKYLLLVNHKPLHTESLSYQKYLDQIINLQHQLNTKYSFINLK